LNVDKIGTEYLSTRICNVLKAQKQIDWGLITEVRLQDSLPRFDNSVPVIQFFEDKLRERIDSDFQAKNAIIYQGMDKYAEMSSGLDAKIYFDLMAYESGRDGIYIIDQPEDNISQSAIKTYLLDRFKTMGENRQVIMVTHNPQFVVNLDIDNLIYMTKKEGAIQIQSGALEYVCDDYNVLDIVAKNIDGGLDSIQKRWKRYAKATNI
jgi:predicted ATP-dependent endonuclease of OLD family